jgi:DNA-binding NarL/FixJ family response regulator
MTAKSTDASRIRILCVDDHALMREAITAVIRNEPDMLLAAEACSGSEAIETFRLHQPDVTLMDFRLNGMNGIDALVAIRTEFPQARVVMLTTFESAADMRRALEAGAQGYLLKSMPRRELLQFIRQVHSGDNS